MLRRDRFQVESSDQKLTLLAASGDREKFIDFIALGRPKEEAWEGLKKRKSKQ